MIAEAQGSTAHNEDGTALPLREEGSIDFPSGPAPDTGRIRRERPKAPPAKTAPVHPEKWNRLAVLRKTVRKPNLQRSRCHR